jgi:hypothetical protein
MSLKKGVSMENVIVANFGVKDNIQTYRINGPKEKLVAIIEEIYLANADLAEYPELKRLRYRQWTLLLKIKMPVGVCEND